jgi:parallel beta-helix repeat protein
LKKNAYIAAAFNLFFHPKPKKDEIQNFIPNCPPLWALILIAMCGYESYAQEGGHCTCADPDFNVVIDPVLYPTGATLNQLQSAYPFFAGNAMTNTCLSIDGHLIVNKNFTITGGEIIMAPGAEITVNRRLTLVDVNQNGGVHGCTRMWKGISATLNPSTTVVITLTNTIIQDARHAIRTNKNTQVSAQGSQFLNNYVGILLPAWESILVPNPVYNLSGLTLDGNLFATSGQYLPPYSGISSDPNTDMGQYLIPGFIGIGILAHRVSALSIGNASFAPNVFDGLNVGIYNIEPNMLVRNNIFRNIGPLESGVFYQNSNQGIHVEYNNLLTTRNTQIEGCAFEACQIGIYAREANLTVRKENSFEDCAIGISILDPIGKSIVVNEQNTIAAERGVHVYGAGPAKAIDISDNTIIIEEMSNSSGFTGIRVAGYPSQLSATDRFNIEDNKIYLSQTAAFDFAGNGIVLGNTAGASVISNSVLDGIGSGIAITNSENTVIKENEVSGVSRAGATIANSPNTKFACNYFETDDSGVSFEGACDCIMDANNLEHCTEISGNYLDSETGGSLALFDAITSPQEWQGNEWHNVDPGFPFPFSYEAIYIGDLNLADFSKFTAHTGALPYHPQHVWVNDVQQDPTVWFIEVQNPGFFQCGPMEAQESSSSKAVEIYEAYASGAFSAAGYGTGAQWLAERHLYRNLKRAPGLLSAAGLQQFYGQAETGVLGGFYAVEAGLASLYDIPQEAKNTLGALQEAEALHAAELAALYAVPTPSDTAELAALEQMRQSAAEALTEAMSEIEQIQAVLSAARSAQVEQLKTLNAGISVAAAPAQYLQAVYAAWLAQAGGDSWSGAELAALEHIAALCPREGGDAVYFARAMLNRLGDDGCLEWPEATAPPALPDAMRARTEERVGGVFPNPGRGEFFLQAPATASGLAEFRLYALTGQLAFRAVVPAGERAALDLAALPGGLYLYEVWDAGERLMNGKLNKTD